MISISNAGSSPPRRWKRVGFLRHASILSISFEDADQNYSSTLKKEGQLGRTSPSKCNLLVFRPSKSRPLRRKVFCSISRIDISTETRCSKRCLDENGSMFSYSLGWARRIQTEHHFGYLQNSQEIQTCHTLLISGHYYSIREIFYNVPQKSI